MACSAAPMSRVRIPSERRPTLPDTRRRVDGRAPSRQRLRAISSGAPPKRLDGLGAPVYFRQLLPAMISFRTVVKRGAVAFALRPAPWKAEILRA